MATIPLECKVRTSTFSEYLSVYGLMPSEGEVNIILKYLNDAKDVFDIGANVGVWSVLMSKANPNATIHSFEPNPETFLLLQANIEQNNCLNVKSNNFAVSDTTETLEFQVPENASILGRVRPTKNVKDDDGRFDNSKTIEVQSLTLFDYCQQNSVEKIDFLKIDIEGHELPALMSLELMLREHRVKAIHIETIEANHIRMGSSYHALLEFLQSCGYQFFTIRDDNLYREPIPLDKISEHNHICLPI
jgi:FkbM family methyltransferase|nr:FkbM family methyltransferase [Aphanizomenon flos-aquae]